jgi:hypothetical protein
MGLDAAYGIGSLKPGVCTSSTRPASPFEGQVIFETDTDRLYVYNGTAWVIPNSPAQNPQGLELITTVTCSSGGTASGGVVTIGSAVSSVVVANAFNSTYDNYKIVASGGVGNTPQAITMALTGSTASYYQILSYVNYATGGATQAAVNNGANWGYIGENSTNATVINIDVINPNIAKYTYFSGSYTGTVAGTIGGYHGVATAYTGFTLAVAGNITGGTIRVYGYRNS